MKVTDEAVEAAWRAFTSLGVYASDKARLIKGLEAALLHLSQGSVRVSAPLHDALQRWRDEDHEEIIALSREQVIEVCEEFRALSPSPVGVTDERKFKAAPTDTQEGVSGAGDELMRWSLHTIPATGAPKMLERKDGKWVLYDDARSALTACQQDAKRWKGRFFKMDANFDRAAARADSAEDRNAELVKALEFYADVSKYPSPFTGGMGALWNDCGEIARSVLGRK